jgi:hypothetical protein
MTRLSSLRWISLPRQTYWSRCPKLPVSPCHDGGCSTGLRGWRPARLYPPLSRWRCLAGQHVPATPRFSYVIGARRSGSTGTRFRRTSPMATRSAHVAPRRRLRVSPPRLLSRPPRPPVRPRRLPRLRRCRPHRRLRPRRLGRPGHRSRFAGPRLGMRRRPDVSTHAPAIIPSGPLVRVPLRTRTSIPQTRDMNRGLRLPAIGHLRLVRPSRGGSA